MSTFAQLIGCVFASKVMHQVLMDGIIHAPLTFFDTTPVGRLLSRFSKDIDIIDNTLPAMLLDGIYCLFEVNCKFSHLLLVLALVLPSDCANGETVK